MADLSSRLLRVALAGRVPSDDTSVIADAQAEIERLHSAFVTACVAADAILAPLTAEYGRLMEENPDYEMVVSFGGYEVSMPASRFMALYRATDRDQP